MSTFSSQTGKLPPQAMLAQRYVIIRLAGRGGMSAIYQAIDMQQGRRHVAIKEMSLENLEADERDDALVRFQQEAHLLASLHHPNLTRIYDSFSEGGRSFLVMDFIEGKTLLQLLQARGEPLPVEQVMHYAEQLCDVLTYLHQHNPAIIFRDLKPTNVMAIPSGHVYLIDFGIARFFKEGQHQDTTVLGSPGYAPPEQHGTGQTNPRSDLYALGATLHCCLSNRDPYHATDKFTFAPVRQFNPLVPEALDQLVLRMVALNEKQRPASAQEVKQALVRIRTPQVHARPSMSAADASAPTQYVQQAQPAFQPTMPAVNQPVNNAPQERLILPSAPDFSPLATTPPNGNSASAATYAALPPPLQMPAATSPGLPPLRQVGGATSPGLPPLRQVGGAGAGVRARVWTPGFLLIFCLFLLLVLGISALAFNIPAPYGSGNPAGLDHIIETGLLLLIVVISLNNLFRARNGLSFMITLGSEIALLTAGSAFLLQTVQDFQNNGLLFSVELLNGLLDAGLLAGSIISLLWLLQRRLAVSDRLWLALLFGAATVCAFLQSQFLDALSRQLLIMSALILLLQGVLLATQVIRKRV
ncbi:MAG TPA: protein kinase [Ktedonobacteraceae bacterium]